MAQPQASSQAPPSPKPQPAAQPEAKPAVDGKAFYGYLFQPDKQPTKRLDALLRGVAVYICENIGDKDEKCLTPAKMAEFYKAVGGNYDSFFVSIPPPSISWIFTSLGCQHTLQPVPHNDYTPPAIPALTTRGFVRWQSIEILLGPEEHVPFLQTAVRDFDIRNPSDGKRFPVDLPAEAFPSRPDEEVERWHRECAERLKRRAGTPGSHGEGESAEGVGSGGRRGEEEDDIPRPRPRPIPRMKTAVQAAYVRVRPAARTARTDADFLEQKSRTGMGGRPLSYQHVSVGAEGRPGGLGAGLGVSVDESGRPIRPKLSRSPSHRARQFLAPEDTTNIRGRRRSYPDNVGSASPSTSPVPDVRVPVGGVYGQPQPPPQPQQQRKDEGSANRRHSHPRHARRGSVSSDASSEDDSPSSPIPRRRSQPHPSVNVADILSGIRFAVPPGEAKGGGERRARESGAGDERRRASRERERERDRDREEDVYGGWETHRQRERERREREDDERRRKDRERERDGADEGMKRSSSAVFGIPIPVDITGKLSRQFLGTGTKREAGSRSGSRGGATNGGVKWRDSDGQEARRRGERGSRSEEDERRYRDRDRDREPVGARHDRSRERERDSGGSSRSDHRRRERERERDRERDRDRERERERERHRESDPPRPRFQRRGSSLEDFSRRDRERDRERERDMGRDRRMPSPVRGINGRRYPAPAVDGGR